MVNPGDGHDEAPRAAEPPSAYVPAQPYQPSQPVAPPPGMPPQPITPWALTAPPLPSAGQAPPTTTAAGVSAAELAHALELVEKSKSRKRWGRRAALGLAGVALCAGAVELGPLALNKAGEVASNEAKDAFNAGVEAGRQAILNEIAQLEGVTLDGAIAVAQLTKLGVKYILVPLSKLTATIEGDALQVLIGAVSTARSNLAHFNITVQWMDNMQTLLTTWHENVTQLPKSLSDYATADVDGALTYLTALKKLLAAEQSAATPTPTK